jgi:MFS family permease
MPLTETQQHPFDIWKARQQGMRTYAYGGLVQMMVFACLLMSILWIEHNLMESRYHLGRSFGAFLIQRDVRSYLIAGFVGGAVYCVLLGWLGRGAAVAIQVKRRAFGWVGVGTVALPSIVAAVILTLVLKLQYLGERTQHFEFGPKHLEITMGFWSAVFYVPGVGTGVVAGFLLRQRERQRAEKILQQQSLSSAA